MRFVAVIHKGAVWSDLQAKRGSQYDCPAVRCSHRVLSMPEKLIGRFDVGIAYVPRDLAISACRETGREPFDVRTETRGVPVLTGCHIAVGSPQDRQVSTGRGHPFVESAVLEPCRVYKTGNFKYIGYGVNGEREIGVDRSRSWKGYSGAPVWVVEPKADREVKLRERGAVVSPDDFEKPYPVAMLCYQRTDDWNLTLGPPKGSITNCMRTPWTLIFLRASG